MNAQTWFIVAVIMIVGIVDLSLWFGCGAACTLSKQLLSASEQYPILPFALGVLVGHLLWPQSR